MNYGKKISQPYLEKVKSNFKTLGYRPPRWSYFCEVMLIHGFRVYMYEAKNTNSKYVTIEKDKKTFKVRFSDHKPIFEREIKKDCDFFVGITNTGTRTTENAIQAALGWFPSAVK